MLASHFPICIKQIYFGNLMENKTSRVKRALIRHLSKLWAKWQGTCVYWAGSRWFTVLEKSPRERKGHVLYAWVQDIQAVQTVSIDAWGAGESPFQRTWISEGGGQGKKMLWSRSPRTSSLHQNGGLWEEQVWPPACTFPLLSQCPRDLVRA